MDTEKILGPQHTETLISKVGLATTLRVQGKNAEAESLFHEVVRISQKVLGSQHASTLALKSALATTLRAQGENAEAESLHREAVASREKVPESQHTDTPLSKDLATSPFIQEIDVGVPECSPPVRYPVTHCTSAGVGHSVPHIVHGRCMVFEVHCVIKSDSLRSTGGMGTQETVLSYVSRGGSAQHGGQELNDVHMRRCAPALSVENIEGETLGFDATPKRSTRALTAIRDGGNPS